uniref:SAM_MT_RSMB_NOP domain-containing protein n=2 Tax=Rhodnius prolixus TaxID=13249 RepID=T1HZ21_RHOPR
MYRFAADICRRTEAGESLKNLLYSSESSKFSNDIPSIRALVDTALRNRIVIDDLISRTNLNEELVFNEIWIARVLVAEIIFGKKSFHCSDAITKKVYKYKDELKSLSEDAKKIEKTFIPRYVRINTLNCTKHEFYKAMSSHFKLTEVGDKNEVSYEDFLKFIKKMKKTEYVQDFHLADLYVFHPKANLTLSPLFIANKIILQDKASCLVAPLLAPTPGSLIIDMCAAPGYKTQHLSSITGNSGHILALDICRDRYQVLANTRINYGLSNVITLNVDALNLSEAGTKCIEYILLDAPCSGSGVVQNFDYGTDNRSGKKRLQSLHNLQAYLLRTTLTQFPSARRIVYSTCSLHEEENEAVVDELLDIAEKNKFILVNLKNHYQDFSTGIDKYKCGRSTIRMVPEQSFTNGFFIALFERTNPPNPSPRMEFYKNMNSILDNIIIKRKRKVDETELNNTDENAKRKDVVKEVLNENEKKIKGENKKKEFSDDENHKQRKSVSPEKEYKQVQKEKVNEPNVKILTPNCDNVSKNAGNSSNDSSDEEQIKKETSFTPESENVKGNYIRVVRSPLLKNILPNSGDQQDDDSEHSDNSEEAVRKDKQNEDSETSDDNEDDVSEGSSNRKIMSKQINNEKNKSNEDEEEEEEEDNDDDDDNVSDDDEFDNSRYKSQFSNSPTKFKQRNLNDGRHFEERFNSSKNDFNYFRNQRRGRGRGRRGGNYHGRGGY